MKISKKANVGHSHDKVPNTRPIFGTDGDETELMRRSVGRRRGEARGNADIVCRGGQREWIQMPRKTPGKLHPFEGVGDSRVTK